MPTSSDVLHPRGSSPADSYELSHLNALEAEAVYIFREVAATFERPVLLFSGGKDSVVMLHVAAKAFWPSPLPFPVMHIDTGHNFDEVIAFRDETVGRYNLRLEVGSVQDDIDSGAVVEETGPAPPVTACRPRPCCAASTSTASTPCSAARGDEEKARAKERVFSFPRRVRPVGSTRTTP